ncbi:hypothetical protein EIP91_009230 [Steccherinum ochraceum]|uniref:RanBP2-type domain-containing protein n=1 Tax=Steccherinum ochraceum TaxID=92696 RepID=A0A4R0RXV4_9APHY|nr:hypothetical protein EIP91_009230 [Steccherinum ochraceum]
MAIPTRLNVSRHNIAWSCESQALDRSTCSLASEQLIIASLAASDAQEDAGIWPLSDLWEPNHLQLGRKTEAKQQLDDDTAIPSPSYLQIIPARQDVCIDSGTLTSAYETFLDTRSRVLQLHKPWMASTPTHETQYVKNLQPSLWRVGEQEEVLMAEDDSLWAVFKTHEEACSALLTANPTLILSPATEQDLEATHNLHQITWSELESMSSLAVSAESMGRSAAPSYSPPWAYSNDLRPDSVPGPTYGTPREILQSHGHPELYNLSSNPPNPKLSFRAGDWWRNVGCIKCGTPRIPNGTQAGSGLNTVRTSPPPQISPRFINQLGPLDDASHMLEARLPPQHVLRTHLAGRTNHGPAPSQSMNFPSKAPVPQYPILTPSGAALSAGGRVRNVSIDPLSPCIMYWPDNEPIPEPGQIRPFGSAVVQFPPIINTGNKGAAEKQPGDWICQKCKYLNWRRRKVCQTCFPYAEGNGDSISAAVQAERIALLAGVLNKTEPSPLPPRQLPVPPNGYARDYPREWQDESLRVVPRQGFPPARTQSIYQTPESLSYTHTSASQLDYDPSNPTISRNLLPSFLQDIVHPPALSPAGSTSSSDTGLEDSFAAFDIADTLAGPRMRRHPYSTSSSSSSTSIASIWKLDGQESKTYKLGNVSPIEKAPTAFTSFA